jgi:hypothetical protein
MRKLTRSNKISEISMIWSVVLVSIDQAAAAVAASPALRPDEARLWFNFNFPVGLPSVSRRISFLSHFNFAFCSISHSIFYSIFRSTFRSIFFFTPKCIQIIDSIRLVPVVLFRSFPVFPVSFPSVSRRISSPSHFNFAFYSISD